MKHYLPIIFLVVLIIGFSAFAAPMDGRCSDNVMTVPFLKVSGSIINNLDQTLPLGNIDAGHVMPTAHLYLNLVRTTAGDMTTPSLETWILAPGAVRIVAIAKHPDSHVSGNIDAYKVTMKACDNTYFYVDHINQLSNDIWSVVGSTLGGCSNCFWIDQSTGIELGANDKIGKTWSTHAIDIGSFDLTFAAPYTSPSNFVPDYNAISSAYGVPVADVKILIPSLSYKKCALNYFDSSTVSLLNSYNPRTVSPVCGEFAQDISGAATGTWYPLSWNGTFPRFLGIGYDNEEATANLSYDYITPATPAFSLGNTIPIVDTNGTVAVSTLSEGNYYFTPYTSPTTYWDRENWLFENIPVGNEVYCFRELKSSPGGSAIPNLILLVQTRTQSVGGTNKTVLRMQARNTSTCPNVSNRHMNGGGLTAEFLRD